MHRIVCISLVLIALFDLQPAAASAQARTYALPQPSYMPDGAPSFSAQDSAWLQRNRSIAIAGKVLTVVGVVSIFALALTVDSPVWPTGSVVQVLGQLMWTGADLAATTRLRRMGMHLPLGAPITALVGAVVFSPVAWIAGPIASARIREAGDSLSAARTLDSRLTSYGAGFRLAF